MRDRIAPALDAAKREAHQEGGTMDIHTNQVLEEIATERNNQRAVLGDEYADTTMEEWVPLFLERISGILLAPKDDTRRQVVMLAALVVAAVEAFDYPDK
ncbi:MAG: hypothetical protein WAU32_06280 [Thermoanaerobaculia bacterium]|jgi:hypothetical protein